MTTRRWRNPRRRAGVTLIAGDDGAPRAFASDAREGLLEPVRNRGFRVVALDFKELSGTFAIRLLLEVPTLAEVARRGTSPAQLKELHRLADTIKRAADKGDLIGFLDADRKFHVALVDLAGNKPLSKLVATLRDRVRLFGFADRRTSEHLATSAAEHYRLLELLEQHDADGAAAMMKHHLERSRDLWASAVPGGESKPPRQEDVATATAGA